MLNILLAEDDSSMRTYLARALEKVGYRVTAVEHGQAAQAADASVRIGVARGEHRALRAATAQPLAHRPQIGERQKRVDAGVHTRGPSIAHPSDSNAALGDQENDRDPVSSQVIAPAPQTPQSPALALAALDRRIADLTAEEESSKRELTE